MTMQPITGERMRAALYLRVSTGRQVETDLSIPDQKAQATQWCRTKGWQVAADYVEAGASATDDRRSVFQAMIERACDGSKPFDVIVVHSYSRFFRDAFGLEFYIRRLAKHGIKLISITQELGDDPAQVMMRQVIAMFDEYQSRENAKHVLRSMKENARQGFWNGSSPPFGYTTQEAGRKGARIKKVLAIDPVEAETIRKIFALLLEGDGKSGPLGIKAICHWLNTRGYRTRRGARFGVGPLHLIVTNTIYRGTARFNRQEARSRAWKAEGEVIEISVPAIIVPERFEAAQTLLRSRNPKVTPPRVTTGPILLTGLAACAECAGGMTLRTGTSRLGKVHRYYACSTCARQGKTACSGRSIAMDRLDDAVTNALSERLFTPERLTVMLSSLKERRQVQNSGVEERLRDLQTQATTASDKLKRLYAAIEAGIADLGDQLFRDRIDTLRTEHDQAQAALDRAREQRVNSIIIAPDLIDRFAHLMRHNIRHGEIPFRKAYLRAIIDRVEVDKSIIRIVGRKDVLERAIIAGGSMAPAVRSFVREWRTRQDSNL